MHPGGTDRTAAEPRGFTLIELMIVVAIIAALSAIALPAYQSYVQTANMTRLDSHTRDAVDFIDLEFQRVRTLAAMGVDVDDDEVTAEAVREVLNDAGTAPGGGPPFGATADADIGRVGLMSSGGLSTQDLTFTVVRPEYAALAEQTIEVSLDGAIVVDDEVRRPPRGGSRRNGGSNRGRGGYRDGNRR